MNYRALNSYCKKSWICINLKTCDNQLQIWG